jgi:hypothetical protein
MRLARFVNETIFQVVVGVAVVAVVTVVALIGHYWMWPNAIVGAVLLASGLTYLMDRFGLGPSTRSKVRNWIDRSGFSIKTVQDTNEFHFTLTDNIGLVTDILQIRSGGPIMMVSAHHKASPAQLTSFHALTPAEQYAFWRNVRLELLRYGTSFSSLTLEGEGVAFSDSVESDRGLTETDFLKRLLFVRSSGRLYWELLLVLNPPSVPSPTDLETLTAARQ